MARDNFEKVHADLARSCNYILIFNGVLIAAIITAFWNWTSVNINGDLILNCVNCTNNTSSSMCFDQICRKFNFLLILFPCFLSLACSIGVFNSGLYPKFSDPVPSIRELKKREDKAFYWYTWVLTFIGIAVLSIFQYLFSLLFPSWTLISAIILYPAYFILLYLTDAFSQFGLSRKESIRQDIESISRFLGLNIWYVAFIILALIILLFWSNNVCS